MVSSFASFSVSILTHFYVFFEHILRRTWLVIRDIQYLIQSKRLVYTLFLINFYRFFSYSNDEFKHDCAAWPDPDELTYGVTPLATIESILSLYFSAGTCHTKTFYDLGCGMGSLVFFMREFYGMTSIGVEINPRFHQFSTKAAAAVGWDRIDFKLQSILDTDVTPADIIYSTMTCLNAKTRHSLRRVCETCRPGTLVVTTSQSLESPLFKVLDVKPVWFSWGRGQVYIHQRQ